MDMGFMPERNIPFEKPEYLSSLFPFRFEPAIFFRRWIIPKMSNTGITDSLIIISTVGFSKNQLLNFTATIAGKNSTKAAPPANNIPCFRLFEKLISITVIFSIPIGKEPIKLARKPIRNMLMIVMFSCLVSD